MGRNHPCQRLDRRRGAASILHGGSYRVPPTTTSTTALAAEPGAGYDTGSAPGTGDEPKTDTSDHGTQVLDRLLTIAQEAAQLDLDVLTDAQAERCLDDLRRPLAMLEATRSRLLANLEARAARRVRPGGSSRGAKDEQRRRSAKRQHIPRSRAKREAEAGHAADKHQATGAAFAEGDIGPDHVRLIADLLGQVSFDHRAEVEAQLLALARDHEPVSFGRRARALLHELAPETTAEAERRQESRRELRIADTPDGGLALSGLLHGTSAELARVALDAFKRFDTPGEPRTVEQRNADAFLQLCEVALKAEQAPTQHGARPHVLVIVRAEGLDGGAGPARFGFSGQPVNLAQARRLFSDAIVSRIAFAADGTPIEASANVRTVPAGLHRALVARDGGCTWDGCDAPPSWCDVAHGNVPFRANEPLHVGDSALLCRRHHRRFDHGRYRMVIEGGRVSYLRLDDGGQPLGAAATGANGPTGTSGTTGTTRATRATSTGAATSRKQQPRTDSAITPSGEQTTQSGEPPPDPAVGRDRPVRGPAGKQPGDAPPPAAANAPPQFGDRRAPSKGTGGCGPDPSPPTAGMPEPDEDQPSLFSEGLE